MGTLEKGVFIVNFEDFTYISVSIIDFELVNISWADTHVHKWYFIFSNILDTWVSQSNQKKKNGKKRLRFWFCLRSSRPEVFC